MKIRAAKREYIKYVVNLNQRLSEYHLQFDGDYYKLKSNLEDISTKHFEGMLTSEVSILLVAEDNGAIVGYLAGEIRNRAPVFEVDKKGRIWAAYVSEEYRGRGGGRELTERILRWFAERGIKYVELSVDSRNELGYIVWKSLGFETLQFVMKRRIDRSNRF